MVVKEKRVETALLSLSDKRNLASLAAGLHECGVQLVSTGGTLKAIEQAGFTAIDVAEFTGQPELLGGLVKTIHPAIAGGILANKQVEAQLMELKLAGMQPIDHVIVNFYPFAKIASKPKVSLDELIANIDIGGPTMVRAAAKSFQSTSVITDIEQYNHFLELLREGQIDCCQRYAWACSALAKVAQLDHQIFSGLNLYKSEKKNETMVMVEHLPLLRNTQLRYGENPQQQAALYDLKITEQVENKSSNFEQVQGKDLSYNNLLDLQAAVRLVAQFSQTDGCNCAIIKHNNPCAMAAGVNSKDALQRARVSDRLSSFGGIIACNQTIDLAAAQETVEQFCELLIAPDFTDDALSLLSSKPDLRVIKVVDLSKWRNIPKKEYRSFADGLLVQEGFCLPEHWQENLQQQAIAANISADLFLDLSLAQVLCAYAKSNSVVLVAQGQSIGIGAGQMSRIDAVEIACQKAKKAGHQIKGAVAASDGFFPFADSIDLLAEEGVQVIIQPGGSVRDEEVIERAKQAGIKMILTGYRCFIH